MLRILKGVAIDYHANNPYQTGVQGVYSSEKKKTGEISVISLAHTSADPRAVMIMYLNAGVTSPTMKRSGWP